MSTANTIQFQRALKSNAIKASWPHFEVLQLLAAFVALLNKVHKQRKANHKPVSPATGERGDDEVHHWHSGLSSENLKMLGVWAEEFLPD